MLKKNLPEDSHTDLSEKSLPSFTTIQSRVFTNKDGRVFISGVLIEGKLREVLRDEAKYMESSQLWEVLNASVTDEAYRLALSQSTNFEQVNFAKALHHWAHFLRNVLNELAK